MKEKKKGKMKIVDTMPIKRTQFGRTDAKMQEADASQDQEEKAGPVRRKRGLEGGSTLIISR